jgi:hypothetical protein
VVQLRISASHFRFQVPGFRFVVTVVGRRHETPEERQEIRPSTFDLQTLDSFDFCYRCFYRDFASLNFCLLTLTFNLGDFNLDFCSASMKEFFVSVVYSFASLVVKI